MGFRCTQAVIHSDHGLKGKSYVTLLALAHYADDVTGVCWPGHRALGFAARQSVRTTAWAIEELGRSGWIQIIRRGGPKGTNRYRLDLERLRSASVRHRPTHKNTLSTPVHKPVESLWKPCGSGLQNRGPNPDRYANGGVGIIKEVIGKHREEQEETETAGTGFNFPTVPVLPVDPEKAAKLRAFLDRLLSTPDRPRLQVAGLRQR